jgi:hypothetical protein
MQLDVRLNENDTEVAIHFPDPSPGFTLLFTAVQLEEFIAILLDVRRECSRRTRCQANGRSTMMID